MICYLLKTTLLPDSAIILPEYSTREKVTAITEIEGTACAACHTNQINPAGFPSEQYDTLGRFRSFEVVYDDAGIEIARPAVDSQTIPGIDAGDVRPVTGAVELSQHIAESSKTQACFSRHYFRFAYGRHEDLNTDGCALQSLEDQLITTPLRDFLKSVTLHPQFKWRQSD